MNKQKLRCSVSITSEFLGESWCMHILREFMIFGGTRRFEQLYDALGISRNILTIRLRRFLELGLIRKAPIFENSRRMEYKLRRKAWELAGVMLALHAWAQRWSEHDDRSELDFVDAYQHQPLAGAQVYSRDGRVLQPWQILVVAKTENARLYLEQFRTMPANQPKRPLQGPQSMGRGFPAGGNLLPSTGKI